MPENPLWNYSLTVYGKAGMEPVLLALQDQFDVDINLVLLALYVSRQGWQLSPADMRALVDTVQEWQQQVVQPLRAVRRYMKPLPADSLQEMRGRIKALELEAEAREQHDLYQALLKKTWSVVTEEFSALALHNLQAYSQVLKTSDWEDVAALMMDVILLAEDKPLG